MRVCAVPGSDSASSTPTHSPTTTTSSTRRLLRAGIEVLRCHWRRFVNQEDGDAIDNGVCQPAGGATQHISGRGEAALAPRAYEDLRPRGRLLVHGVIPASLAWR